MEKSDIHILLFYKFVEINSPEEFKKTHLNECEELGIRGKILIAKEGINGSISGSKEQVDNYKRLMHSKIEFNYLWFKEDVGKMHPFRKMNIRVRDEIVSLKHKVDLSKTGNYLEPKEIMDLYDKEGKLKENVVFLDARNDYEYKVGRFKDSIQINTKTFREFPEKIKELEKRPDIKDKKIVMFCTGGIRCEKASVVLKEAGFKDVNQVHGGVINFVQNYPDTFWEGKLFVFDKRLVIPVNKKDSKPISNCEICDVRCDLYKNCRNPECDKLVILCLECQMKYHGCCSKNCFKSFHEICTKKSIIKQIKRKQEIVVQ
jgi:UPF0176 protein